MSELPFIDVHSIALAVAPEDTWDAIASLLPRFGGPAGPALARLLGCSDTTRPPPTDGLPASFVGFHVARAERPSILSLQGEHRFSRYELSFEIEPVSVSQSVLRACTRALFPGAAGKAYRAAVIASGAHRLAVRRMLATIKHRAERGR